MHAKKTETKNPNPKDWMSEGVFLAAVPLIVYLWCYCYKLAYLTRFDVPTYLVSINTNSLLLYGAGGLSFGWIVLMLANREFAMDSIEEMTTVNYGQNFGIFVRYLFVIILIVSISFIGNNRIYLLLLPAFMAIDFAFTATSTKSGESVFKRLRGILILHPSEQHLNRFNTPSGRLFLQLVALLLLGMSFAFISGWRNAMDQNSFYSLEADSTSLVVDITDGKAICVFYDPQTHKLLNRIKLLPLGEKDEITLVKRKVNLSTD